MAVLSHEEFVRELEKCADVSPEMTAMLADILMVLNESTGFKLNVDVLYDMFNYLGGLSSGEYPKISKRIPKSEMIRVFYIALDVIPETKDTLTHDEKLTAAFFVYYFMAGNNSAKLLSSDGVRELLADEMRKSPGKFAFLNECTQSTQL